MMKRVILTVIAVIFVSTGAVLMCSCIDNETGGGGEKEMTEITIVGDDSNGEESRTTMQEIEETKMLLEKLLDDNYDVFSQIINYLERVPEDYHFRVEDGEIVVWYMNKPSLQRIYVEFSEIKVADSVEYVIKELGFISVDKSDDYTLFPMINGDRHPYGGSFAQGLVCNNSNSDEKSIQDWDAGVLGQDIRLRDEWFYYFRRGNH